MNKYICTCCSLMPNCCCCSYRRGTAVDRCAWVPCHHRRKVCALHQRCSPRWGEYYICVYRNIYVDIRVYVYMFICLYVHECMRINSASRKREGLCTAALHQRCSPWRGMRYLCVYMIIHVCIHKYMYVYTYTSIYVCIYVNTYVCICILRHDRAMVCALRQRCRPRRGVS